MKTYRLIFCSDEQDGNQTISKILRTDKFTFSEEELEDARIHKHMDDGQIDSAAASFMLQRMFNSINKKKNEVVE